MRDRRPQASQAPPAPSEWVCRFLGGVRPGGRVLDVACGSGRHLTLGLGRGLAMVGIDRDVTGARKIAADGRLELVEADLEDGRPFPLAGERFDGVIVTNYLWRPLLPAIAGCVGPAGVLVYETFAVGNERFGKPSNPDFLLRPGELLALARGELEVVAYEHVRLTGPDRIVQRMAAVGHGHAWLAAGGPPPGQT